MIRQTLKGRSVSPLKGILTIAGLAVSIVLVSWIERAVAMSTGFQYGAFVVWILVALEAVAIVRMGVMEMAYSVRDGHFIVERVYGQNARPVQDIPLTDILDVGPKDDIFARYGNGQAFDKATMKAVTLPEMAIAYRKEWGNRPSLLVIQPNEEILEALRESVAAQKGS